MGGIVLRFNLSGAFFIAFLALTAVMGVLYLRVTLADAETPAVADLLRGTWTPEFEASLDRALPVNTLSRALWGRAEYALFGQGRKGVIAGNDGWLFTDEEFTCPHHYARNLQDNLAVVSATQARLKAAGIKLVVILVPAKARLFPRIKLPACRTSLYADIRAAMKLDNISVADLLTVLKPQSFFKTDTHWTPDGARIAAQAAARSMPRGTQSFLTISGVEKTHEGDLLRYVPGVIFAPETFVPYATEAATSGNLFGDAPAPAIVLAGTSYSANADWNFAGFLKQYLKADVLNVAAEGHGPFTVMADYLESDAWKNAPPRFIVWEMPERYFLSPSGRIAK